MKKSIHKKLIRAHWLGEKEAEILRDAVPWPEDGEPDDIEITIPVGPPYVAEKGPLAKFRGPYLEIEEGKYFYPEGLSERFTEMWVNKNRLRIDAALHFGETRVITEVTPTMGAGSTGKVTIYVDLYERDMDLPRDQLQPCIIGREYHQSTRWYCKDHDIWMGIVPEGGPLNWIIHP